MEKNSSPSRAQRQCALAEREKCHISQRKTLLTAITAMEEVLDRDGEDLVDELRLQTCITGTSTTV